MRRDALTNVEPLSETYFPGEDAPSTEKALERAKKEGLKVVYPEKNQLQIDIDRPEDYKIWAEHRFIVERFLKIKKIVETPSKEAGHWHIVVDLGVQIEPIQRILLQAVLGSDRKRELLGFVMLNNGEEKPTLFLESKS